MGKVTRLTNELIEALDAKLKKLISLVEDDKRKP